MTAEDSPSLDDLIGPPVSPEEEAQTVISDAELRSLGVRVPATRADSSKVAPGPGEKLPKFL